MNGYDYEKDSLENSARALFEIAEALRALLYAFKFSRDNGMSVAEAIEVGANSIAAAIECAAERLEA